MLNDHYIMPCGCDYGPKAKELLRACTFHIQASRSLGDAPQCTPSSPSSSSAAPNSAPRR